MRMVNTFEEMKKRNNEELVNSDEETSVNMPANSYNTLFNQLRN